jgi:hypothetical protein
MLRIRKLKESKQIEAINMCVVDANPIPRMPTDNRRKPPASGIRLSNLETSQPESGRPTKEATGIKSNMVPSCASLYPKADLMVGMRDAHDEKQKPDRKKNKLRKTLCLFFKSMPI